VFLRTLYHTHVTFEAAHWRRTLWWLVPALFCLWFHSPTLGFWFRADDFAWLGLRLSIHDPASLARALFEPQAQGTSRFLSERGFFLLFETLFGLNALPFRIAVLAALTAACVLLAAITRKLTGSDAAAAIAPLVWTPLAGLSSAAGWLSSSNQIWFSLFFLGAFWLFLKSRMAGCWMLYLAGFGTLESMVVFPAVCAVYATLLDRARLRTAFALFVPAAVFVALHFTVLGRINRDPAYSKFFDPASVADTARFYVGMALTGNAWTAPAGIALAILGATVAWLAWRRDFLPLFGCAWFALTLAPVLPLRDHRMLYYLAAPGMALGFTFAAALAGAARRRRALALAPALAVLLVVSANARQSAWIQAWHQTRTAETASLVRGVEAAHAAHAGKAILLDRIPNELFWDAIFDNPFRILGISRVFLAPGAEAAIDAHPEWGGINAWLAPPAGVREWFRDEAVVVYAWEDGRLVNVTRAWRSKAAALGAELSPFVDLGVPAFAAQLGEGWHELEANRARWMSGRALVTLNASRAVARELVISAYAPAALLADGPVELAASLNGTFAGKETVRSGDAPFEIVIPLPAPLPPTVQVELRASRTIRPAGDGRELSFAFGTVQIR
jgi:hypothetical protein